VNAAVPGSEIRHFARTRHGLPFSRGGECAEALRDFLAARGLD